MADLLRHSIPPERAQEVQPLLATAEEVATYEEMRDEIEGAAEVLESHRAEFDALLADPHAATDRAHELFAEECFRPLRFTAADAHRAFAVVGYPSRPAKWSEDDTEKIVAAIMHLANKECRQSLSRRLMMLLPGYVKAGRYVDGWLIQYCAFLLLEAPDRGNPFLAEMFDYGFTEWAGQVRDQRREVVHLLGMDEAAAATMSVEEFEAWQQAQVSTPEKVAQFEAYYQEHPLLRDQAAAEFQALERRSLELLERDDAHPLYLSEEEIDRWMPAVEERLSEIGQRIRRDMERGQVDPAAYQEQAFDTLAQLAREMAPAIFTPTRLSELIAGLQDYRHLLSAAGERDAALLAYVAAAALGRVEVSGHPFLVGVCLVSLRTRLMALQERSRQAEQEGQTK
jgi:hypothetical protein